MEGFAQPTAGRVLFRGEPLTGAGPERGVWFQAYALFPWRILAAIDEAWCCRPTAFWCWRAAPGRIKAVVENTLPRPRPAQRITPAFAALVA